MKILDQYVSTDFTAYHADNIDVVAGMPEGSIDLTVTSPPFPLMYAYSDSPRDMGNCKTVAEMLEHIRHLSVGLLRATREGRSLCIHCTNLNAFLSRDGFIGRFDFRGDLIRLFQETGWAYATEILIDKCPQMRRARTNDRGLLFKSLVHDSSVLSQVAADYLLVFRKIGVNPNPIRAGISDRYCQHDGWITEDQWVDWAQCVYNAVDAGWVTEDEGWQTLKGIWYRHVPGRENGIRETDVMNVSAAREAEDERHLCPLQLGVIERCIKLWSAPGEVVFDPFGGIGSTPYQAIKLGRKGLMAELKDSYYRQAVRNCKRAEAEKPRQRSFFDLETDPEPVEVAS